ncbi:hypothetical protein SpCBS45565_g07351 [Spizellomyces sp. 'palustris']|nr:hypothetical protein SpCBS45565_g07351 [Spizellomyces sp. 'palustris']
MAPIRRNYSVDNTRSDIVDISEVKQLVNGKGGEEYVLIDVREPSEVSLGRIPTAQHIPLGNIQTALQLPDEEFEATYGFRKPSIDDDVIFYCRSGKRSEAALGAAQGLGFKNARNYKGSWLEWSASNHE